MNNNITKYEYRQLPSELILRDEAYQRPIDIRRIHKIAAAFNPDLVNPIKVSHRSDGQYYVFDGQHTLVLLKHMNGGKDLLVSCKVYEGLSYEDEVRLFVEQNGISRQVESIAKLRALYACGDADTKIMVELAAKAGFTVDFKKGQAVSHIVATSKLYKMYKELTPSEFVDALSILREAWNGDPTSICSELLGGMFVFYKTYKGRFKRATLVDKLSKVNPVIPLRQGKSLYTGGDTRFAREILNIYNKNGISRRLPDEF